MSFFKEPTNTSFKPLLSARNGRWELSFIYDDISYCVYIAGISGKITVKAFDDGDEWRMLTHDEWQCEADNDGNLDDVRIIEQATLKEYIQLCLDRFAAIHMFVSPSRII